MSEVTYEFYARCASGFEPLLAQELRDLRIRKVRPLSGGVTFFASLAQMYRACLWLRTASRVLLVLDRVDATDAEALYDGVSQIDWESHIALGKTISVYAHGVNPELRNTQFTGVKVKDAICDRLRRIRGERPDVDSKNADVAIDVSIRFNKATVSINVSGQPLHRRGYRTDGVQTMAPLKETLAASIVLFSGWKETIEAGGVFADPMCGSGTLAIEAAMIAADMAPGIMRSEWGFLGWTKHDEDLWNAALDEADDRLEAGLQNMPRIIAGDADPNAIEIAMANAKRAGLSGCIDFYVGDASELRSKANEGESRPTGGLVVCNPPYGQRLLDLNQLPEVYGSLAQGVEDLGLGWNLAVITPDDSIDTALGLIPEKSLPLFNGAIETMLRMYKLQPGGMLKIPVVTISGKETRVSVSEENSTQFAGRLRKVAFQRMRWAKKNGVSCYRVYDADLNDYAVSVDVYEGVAESKGETYVRVAEYQAPATVDQERAQRRFNDAIALVTAIFELRPDQVFSKTRRRDKGGAQYKDARGNSFVAYTGESGYCFEVDLGGYLDTGIFLDHRVTREMVGKMSQGKSFLNLFAYTGTATVHAAGGGAVSTTTVDMSQTYLNWASRNMERNKFYGRKHKYFREDATEWVFQEVKGTRRYDLIFCDPPTFSNSKAMGERTWSIQRDHVRFLQALGRLLNEEGVIVFSCNLRNFKIDAEELQKCGFEIKDITAETIPEDFERNPKIHHCFVLTLPNGNELLPTFDDVPEKPVRRFDRDGGPRKGAGKGFKGNRERGDRDRNGREHGGRKEGFKPKRDYGDRDGGFKAKRDFKDRDKDFKPKRDFSDRDGDFKPKRDRNDRKDAFKPKRDFSDRKPGERRDDRGGFKKGSGSFKGKGNGSFSKGGRKDYHARG